MAARLAAVGLAEHADHPSHLLSGGQKQLLALSSVLVTEPSILVCDEPTTLLDLRNAAMVAQTLLNLPQRLVVATHDLDLAAATDRAVVVAGGEVAFDSGRSGAGAAVDWYRRHASDPP